MRPDHETPALLLGLIGEGIGESLSPTLYESEAAHRGILCIYQRIDLDELKLGPDHLPELLTAAERLGFAGLNITHPCKQTVLSALDELSPDAELLGAVNTVVFRDGRAIGANTDHSGFAQGLRDGLDSPALDRVVLLGSGGAGSAIAFALLNAGTRVLSVFDPVVERARAVRTALGPAFPGAEIVAIGADELAAAIGAADGLVNATPIGMVGHPGIPVDPSLLHSGLWVADAIYRPLRTELIETAQALGCAVLDGGRMVVGQAADTFRLITGRDADPERMRARFLALTGATQ